MNYWLLKVCSLLSPMNNFKPMVTGSPVRSQNKIQKTWMQERNCPKWHRGQLGRRLIRMSYINESNFQRTILIKRLTISDVWSWKTWKELCDCYEHMLSWADLLAGWSLELELCRCGICPCAPGCKSDPETLLFSNSSPANRSPVALLSKFHHPSLILNKDFNLSTPV